jgi:hypothetical protein
MDFGILIGIEVLALFFTMFAAFKILRVKNIKKINDNVKMSENIEDILNDEPTSEDKIGFSAYSKVLAETILEKNRCQVYGIYGYWGTGKTSLMRMISQDLSNSADIVWFNAWKFKEKVSVFEAFCDVLYNYIDGSSYNIYIKYQVKEILKNLFPKKNKLIRKASVINNISTIMAELVNYKMKLENKKIVIFIDDLDRCLPADALNFLESIKVFFELSNISFVIGMNYDVICSEINKKYKDNTSIYHDFCEEYLAKIINTTFYIPQLEKKTIINFINQNVNEPDIKEISEVFAVGLEKSLRTVKRAINMYLLLKKVATHRWEENKLIKIDNVKLAKIIVISLRYRVEYNKILKNTNYLLFLQDIANEKYDMYYRMKERRSAREPISFKDEISHRYDIINLKDEDLNISFDLREMLRIRGYFSPKEIRDYLCLMDEELSITNQNNNALKMQYYEQIKKGVFGDIENPLVFTPDEIDELAFDILNKYTKYDASAQIESLNIINYAKKKKVFELIVEILEGENKLSVDVREKLTIFLLGKNQDISSYIWNLSKQYQQMSESDKKSLFRILVKALENSNKYAVDIMVEIQKQNGGLQGIDSPTKESMIKALGNIHDKKAISILTDYIQDDNTQIILSAMLGIGNTDPDYFIEQANIWLSSDILRDKVIITLNSIFDSKSEYICNRISLERLLQILDDNSVEKSDMLLEIKKETILLIVKIIKYHAAKEMKISTRVYLLTKEKIKNISRMDDSWEARNEAERSCEILDRIESKLSFEYELNFDFDDSDDWIVEEEN